MGSCSPIQICSMTDGRSTSSNCTIRRVRLTAPSLMNLRSPTNITSKSLRAIFRSELKIQSRKSIYFKILEEIWYQEQVPEDCRRAVIVQIFKKKDITEYDNYIGISLLCHSEKIFATDLLHRIKVRTEAILSETQAGVRSGRSTIDQLYTLRNIVGKYLAHGIDLYACYIDIKKVFHSVW